MVSSVSSDDRNRDTLLHPYHRSGDSPNFSLLAQAASSGKGRVPDHQLPSNRWVGRVETSEQPPYLEGRNGRALQGRLFPKILAGMYPPPRTNVAEETHYENAHHRV